MVLENNYFSKAPLGGKLAEYGNKFNTVVDSSAQTLKAEYEGMQSTKVDGENTYVNNDIHHTEQFREDFEKEIDDIVVVDDSIAKKNADKRTVIQIMNETPKVVLDNVENSENLPIIINYTKLYLATRDKGVIKGNYHNLGADLIKRMPEFLSNPDAIIRLENGRLNFLSRVHTDKGENGILSLELNSLKDVMGKNKKYNVVVTMFSGDENYVKNLINKDGISVVYKKEDLLQVNPQLYNWLATINSSSSSNMVTQPMNNVNNLNDSQIIRINEESDIPNNSENGFTRVDDIDDSFGVRIFEGKNEYGNDVLKIDIDNPDVDAVVDSAEYKRVIEQLNKNNLIPLCFFRVVF